jgi:hypothetical protein
MDLADTMGKALAAARSGDLDGLEVQLSQFRDMPAESVASLRTRLRGIARAVRTHPSYSAPAAAQTA